jgi:peptide/nickel transport system substrate-binding protein
VTGRGHCPRQWRWLVATLGALGLLASACGGSAGGSGTQVTYVGVAGGAISFGMTESVSGCNPNTMEGNNPGALTVLGAVLPSPFVVGADGTPTFNSQLVVSSEVVNINPQTVVYTLNPKAVWSDGVPISAADFKYAWEQQRGDPVASSPDVTSIAGYRDIASVTGSNGGHTVTVKFKNSFGDWKSLFNNLVPAHVMEKVGWSPSCPTVDPAIDLSGGPFKLGSVSASTIRLVQNPKWWGTPANAKSITVHIASSTTQLAQWMSSGYVQVAQPSTVTPSFLTEMTGLPGAESDVQNSNTLLQLDMASALTSKLSPDLRVAIALTLNRQALVNQQVSWAVPGVTPGDSHVYVQGQAAYKPSPSTVPTTTVPVPTTSTSTTVIGAGGSVNFPVTPVPAQAAALVQQAGLVKTASMPLYHYPFGVPFQVHMVVDEGDPWAAAAAPTIHDELEAAGFDTTITMAPTATNAGEQLAAGFADLALMPQTFSPYPSQMLAWYTSNLGPPGKNGSQNWTSFSNAQFEQLVLKASRQLYPNTAATYYQQADTVLWDEMVSLPLYPEPSALVWSRTIGGVTPTPLSTSLLWYAQDWAVRQAESTNNTTPSLPGQ